MQRREFYSFESKTWPVLTGYQVQEILQHKGNQIQLFLGKREVLLSIREDKVFFSWTYPERGEKRITIPIKILEKIKKKHVYTVFPDKHFTRVSRFQDSFFQLIAPHPHSSFTLEIDGINMHAVKGTTPLETTRKKISTLDIQEGDQILDVCTGLGYSAILEKKQGGKVITIEKNQPALQIAQINPESRELEEIPIILEDATSAVSCLPEKNFDKIFHDPPRYSIAGELYSLSFYNELQRIIKSKGVLFHYTGEPGKHQDKKIREGIKNRLRKAGFDILRTIPQGIVAEEASPPI